MGHKKRNAAPRSKQTPVPAPAASPAADGPAQTEPEPKPSSSPIVAKADALAESDSSSFSSVKLECERALTALRRGNHTKALRLMKESCSRYENSPHAALVHRVQGTICIKVASIIDDLNAKQRHLKNALESARRAVQLSPNSVEFAHFYSNLLFEAANDAKEYEEVVAECERALAIENPVDPGKESLHEENQQKIMTAEARINHVQGELRNLIQKSNFASISSWMKNLGGDEKFRVIPIRRATEDPMELRLVQTRRPNEIKKAPKTPEERRKEIEVRVAAARLLQQQKSEVAGSPNEGGDKGLDSSGNGLRGSGDRRKHGKKNMTPAEKKDLVVRSFWSSLSIEKKKQWLSIRVPDLIAHFGFLKEVLANEVISEAVEHADANKTWSFWVCSRCDEKFSDVESHVQHVMRGHFGNVLPNLETILPQGIDDEWVEMIHNCSWKPLDVSAALEMLGNQQKCWGSDSAGDFSSGQKTEECEDSFRDAWDSYPEKDAAGDSFSGGITIAESTDLDRNTGSDNSGHSENHAPLAYSPPDKWPLSDDPERAKLLDRIHTLFEALIGQKCISETHLCKVLSFTMEELQGLTSGSQLLSRGVNHTPISICFLGASQLKKILKFLQEVSNSCGLGRYPEKNTSPTHERNISNQGGESNEKVILNEDGSCLLLDETLLPTESFPSVMYEPAIDVGGRNSNKVGSDTDAFVAWVYSGPSSGTEQLESWVRKREEKAEQHSEIFQMLEKELYSLQIMCDRKSELVGYEEALHVLEGLCIEEGKRKENGSEFPQRSHEAVLRKRKEDLMGDEDDDTFSSSRYESEAVKNVLREAGTLNANQLGDEEAYGSLASHLRDLESGEYDDGRAKECVHQMDACIEVTMQRQKEESSLEICKIDARILRSIATLQQLECKIDAVSALDYRWILVPLIKSYMRTRLEDLAEKDAIEKSDAAREAFLAELALDSNKGVRGGNDSSMKHGHDKTKDKKKHKEHRKTKDSKASGISEQHPHSPESNEPDSFTVSSDGDHPDSEILTFMNPDELKEQEEELRRRMELEAEERKLEETLEYQRRIENEAKQRQLAEQQKKHTQAQLEKPTEGFSDDDAAVPNGSLTILDTQKTGSTDHAEVKRGIPDGGFPQDGTLSSDRRTGRRGRRQKSSTKLLEGKLQASGKENAGAGTLEASPHDDTQDNGDYSTKTLRELHAEEDDEQRFQADLEKAVRQSLDAFQAHQKLPSPSTAVQRTPGHANDAGVTTSEPAAAVTDGSDAIGAGLQNEVGEYNCFLNVIIQSLWHLRRFHDEFLKRSASNHVHVGDPCVICALYEVFHALSMATADSRREAVAPTSLRIALSNLYPDSNFFQKGQMNDASEVLGVIFDCLHRSFTQPSSVSDNESVESNTVGTWDCKYSKACLVHSLFGMDIFERMDCHSCGLESRHLKYTSFFHNINASALRTTKVMSAESSFDDLLDLVERNHQLACDPDSGGCGKLNHIHHFLSSPPHIFTTVLGWQNTRESADDIAATLAALSTDIDMSVLYRGLDPKHIHSLVSVVCYYGQHYHCFAYSHEHDRWIMYDDTNVKVIGSWADVLAMCEKGHLQPQVLFFEAVK
ncbi:hypothetical protein CDL15_Pgr008932 [Punica granatum]|uniref:USP domain-containing protein n=1 Tax=Punica granatum TaxID=22663 RepID=A0A218VZM4_PUNGR|nr:hypothetical protein CDL15_Pgr008932 [Punica granatum]